MPYTHNYEQSPRHRSIIHSQARTVLLRTISPFASKRLTPTAGNIAAVSEHKQSIIAWLQPNKQQPDNMSEQQQNGQRRNNNRNQNNNRNRSNNSNRNRNSNSNSTSNTSRKPRQDNKPKPLVLSGWQKFLIFCKLTSEEKIRKQLQANRPARSSSTSAAPTPEKSRADKPARTNTRVASEKKAPQQVDVETPRLYVGNLSYDATEYDIEDLFKGIGSVKKVEIIYNRHTHKSKGYGFVQMLNVDEATRAVEVLHDQPFLGRNLIVNGSKPRKESDPNSDDYVEENDASKEPAA